MSPFRRAKTLYLLHRHAVPHALWQSVIDELPLLQGLTAVEKARLRELSSLFLRAKNIAGVQGLTLTAAMRIAIAAQACLPILRLGPDIALFDGWRDVIVYPDVFRVVRDETDEFGIVHHGERFLSGESWSKGPLVLCWRELERDRNDPQGQNVVIHEIAHKLDGLNGRCNGMPPLPASMPISEWTTAFSEAYNHLRLRLEHHRTPFINPYAATHPAECFAVFSECFFCAADRVKSHYPAVYHQLRCYYRQDTLQRLTSCEHRTSG